MKLFLINRYFYPDESATSRMVTSLALALSAKGWPVEVLTSRSLHNDPTARLAGTDTVKGVAVHRIRTTAFGRHRLIGRAVDYATFHLATFWHLLRRARRGDLCIVCTDPPLLSVPAILATALRGAGQVNWLHDLFPEVAQVLGVGTRFRRLMRGAVRLRDLSLRHARLNVAPMQSMAAYLGRRGIPEGTLCTLSHWSDGDAIRPVDRRRNALSEEWGLAGRFVVAYSGNFGRAHDFTTFLRAASHLRLRKEIVFVFIGGGHQQSSIEAAIAAMKLDNVIMKPLQPRERLSETLGLADLHLISLSPAMEPFVIPSKLYGILAAGRPAVFVGHLSGEIASILRAGDCGRSVPPGDSAGLADVILSYARDPALGIRQGDNARRLFDARFTEAAGTAAWERVLAEAIIEPAGSRSPVPPPVMP
jgi:glycosyltransferase involved in cell wall biosynthesis